MEDMLNAVRREAARVANTYARTRLALVDSYDPDRHAVRVRLQPEDVLTGWIPWASAMVGNGWGIFAPPGPGDQVKVDFQEGGVETGIAHGALWNDTDRPVVQDDIGKGCPSGEIWIVGPAGGRIRLLKDGTIEQRVKDGTYAILKPDGSVAISARSGTQAKLNADGTVDINGGTLRVGMEGGAFQRLVDERFVALFNAHVHGNTPPPTPQMVIGQHTTTALKGA